MCCKMVWKYCEIWKILWELASRWAKFCEILSHSVRYGMYAKTITNNIMYICYVGSVEERKNNKKKQKQKRRRKKEKKKEREEERKR